MVTRDRDGVPWARASRVLPLDVAAAWSLVADVRHHARWVPMTTVGVERPRPGGDGFDRLPDESPPGVGDEVTAVTGPTVRRGGRGWLVDRMRVERYEPPLGAVPGIAVFVKLGPALGGTARIEVAEAGPGRSRVVWSEAAHVRGLPAGATWWLGALVVGRMTSSALRQAAREATGGQARRGRGAAQRNAA